MRIFVLATLLFGIGIIVNGQQTTPDPHYKLIRGNNFVQSKNYYLLTLLQQDSVVAKMLEHDTLLASIAANKLAGLSKAGKECTGNLACYAERMEFSEKEISDVSARLMALYNNNNALGRLVQKHLIASGAYILYKNSAPAEMLVKAWEQDARGINYAIGVYAEGKKPNYPLIDSISFNVHDRRYGSLLYTTTYTVASECADARLFFVPSLTCALRYLEINEREQAADYEPMTEKANKAAFDRIKTIKWNAYPYSVILVPGAGPEEPQTPLSAEGMLRCRLAAVQYKKGAAPFVVVSGGKVHPYKTTWCEAIEMKKFLIEKLNIPENAIIIEPHARHTTTNLRNCVRLIYRYGMPFNKACVTTTSGGQSMMITNTLAARCLKELNEVPFQNGKRLTETEAEFFPAIEALQINPTEPLDP
ncbi:hypothetical protein A4H97_09100 [Niastella yeongjuensis]|uniref:DUF218 domain-containing protein n=1 Tax=Niastella yeongjuensis TaxID=354355 RepID=A0A1V9EEP5_9BACT|nr:YdcF family protein [Niastella yeongjuensis]OQP44521.1 hypothetical protein A4H97_09100 [Niastella yeongjuensis]SEO84779.1 DUF218 domain-containing protein [Niastella yeongjuensis]